MTVKLRSKGSSGYSLCYSLPSFANLHSYAGGQERNSNRGSRALNWWFVTERY